VPKTPYLIYKIQLYQGKNVDKDVILFYLVFIDSLFL